MIKKPQPRGRSFWPVLGLLLALSSAALAYVFTDPVLTFLDQKLTNFPPRTSSLMLITGIVLFALIATTFSLIVAIAVPRKKSGVTEIQVAKNRAAMVNEKMARKIRQRDINRQGKAR